MAKINCLNPIAACGMDLFNDTYEVVDDFAAADAVLVRSAAMHDLELSDNLLAIARAGAGVNNIPLDKCAEKGIVVFNTPGANANGVKELVIAGLLLASRDLMGGYNWVKENASDENIAKTVEKQKNTMPAARSWVRSSASVGSYVQSAQGSEHRFPSWHGSIWL